MNLTELAMSDALRVVLAMLAGGLIGLEREFRDKAAGFRTLIFIGAGAGLFTILSRNLAPNSDPNRIAANIVTGIGFLGAGAILRDGMRITGLTTAATIWLTAAIGMAFGAGEFIVGTAVTMLALIVLWFFPVFEHAVDRIREENVYEIFITDGMESVTRIEAKMREAGLKSTTAQHFKDGGGLRCRWVAHGKPGAHAKFTQYLLEEPSIKEFKY